MPRLLSLAVASLACATAAQAQPARTTLGAILGAPVDSLRFHWRFGGELGEEDYQVRLARRGTRFVGEVRFTETQSNLARDDLHRAPLREPCDTVLALELSPGSSRQLSDLIARASLESGVPRPQRSVTDVFHDTELQLWSTRGTVSIPRERPVMVRGAPFRMLPDPYWSDRRKVPAPWTRVRALLEQYRRRETREQLWRSCTSRP